MIRVHLLLVAGALLAPAAAQSAGDSEVAGTTKPQSHGLLPIPDYTASSRMYLTGDWGGSRTDLAEQGLQVDVFWTQSGQSVVDGGTDKGWRYGGKLESRWELDLDRMEILPGALINMTTESRYGNSVNSIAGTVLPVNDVQYFPLTTPPEEDLLMTITELRYTQFLSKQFGVFLGKFIPLGGDLNEFAGGRGDTQFMSHPFLTASVTSLINPYSTLGAGAVWMPDERVVVTTSLYSSGDSSTTTGFENLDDGWVWSTSIRNQYQVSGLPGGMMLTGQYGFDNDFVNIEGQFINDGEFIVPLEEDTWNLFWNGWQYLHVDEKTNRLIDLSNGRTDLRGYGLFARVGAADQGTNPVNWVFSGGLGGLGVGRRQYDSYGIGYLYAVVSDKTSITGEELDDDAHRMEAYYTLAIFEGAELSLNYQYANSIKAMVPAATILGLRLRLNF